MEGSGFATPRAHRDSGTLAATRAGVLIASLGALLVVFNPFGLAIAGLVIAAIGVILAARGGAGTRWFFGLAAGAVLMIVSRMVAEGAETLGGWLAVIGALMVLISASLGYPLASDLEE
jgi:hypothetical protein